MSDKHKQGTTAPSSPTTPSAPESDEVKALRAQLAEKEAALAASNAKIAAGNINHAAKSVATAKREHLKASTVRQGTPGEDEVHLFMIPENGEPFYRKGKLYPAGSIVRLPVDEEPSQHWLPVKESPAEGTLVVKNPDPSKADTAKRASDKDL